MYFGITKQDVEKRWDYGRGYKKQCKVFDAIQKYGWNNIEHKVLFENLTFDDAKEKECYLIQKYDSINNGYNNHKGGGAGSSEWKSFQYKGQNYKPSELSEKSVDGVSSHDITTRIGRGWGVDRALFQPKQKRVYQYVYNSKVYSIDELYELRTANITREQFYGRLWRGWDIDRALSQPNYKKNQPYFNQYEYNGNLYTIKELCQISSVDGLTEDNIRDRLKKGWTVERAITQKKRKSPKK